MKKMFAFCLLTLITACSPAQNAPTPTPLRVAVATLPATATPAATSTLTRTATATAAPLPTRTSTPTLTPSPLPTRTPAFLYVNVGGKLLSTPALLYANVDGKLVSMKGTTLHVGLDTGGIVDLEMSAETVVVVRTTSQPSGFVQMVSRSSDALQSAIRENSKASFSLKNGALQGVFVTLPDGAVTALITPTPLPSVTPVLPARWVDMPWGRVNLDVPLQESNNYAMAVWCDRATDLAEQERLSMWATNPNGMIMGRSVAITILNVEVLGKDTDWRADANGAKYFDASVIARNTEDKSDTHRFSLRIYYNAPLAVNVPVDERFDGNYKYAGLFAPVGPTITDINQIRVGQIYAVMDGYCGFACIPAIANYRMVVRKQGTLPLGVYTIAPPWLTTCAFAKAQGWLK